MQVHVGWASGLRTGTTTYKACYVLSRPTSPATSSARVPIAKLD